MNTVHLIDCMDFMADKPDNHYDALITDPPFAYAGGISNGFSSYADSQFFDHWWKDIAKELNRILKPEGCGFIFCDWKSAFIFSNGFNRIKEYQKYEATQCVYHYREMPGLGRPFRSSVDQILFIRGPKYKNERIANTTHNCLSKYWYYGKHKNHPAEKDKEIVKQLVKWATPLRGMVFDPFAGSAPARLVCHDLGFDFEGCEIDPDYWQAQEDRYNTHIQQGGLFGKEEM